MIPLIQKATRRNVLRGLFAGSAVTVGLPFLDCFLNVNGNAFANGTPLPVCFGTWFQGLGFNPGSWEPKTTGPGYENNVQLKALDPFRNKINIISGMKPFLDGNVMVAHQTPWEIGITGGVSKGNVYAPSVDSIIGDTIGTRTRFRSLEASCDGTQTSYSRRSGSSVNPSEVSPMALYARIFGPEFKDPNAAEFTPDPAMIARRSVLSSVKEARDDFAKDLGAGDKARLDEYLTALRELEQQLDLQLQKPAPLEACTVPAKETESKPGTVVEDMRTNTKLMGNILAHALACGQTRVINVIVTAAASVLRRPGSSMTFHQYTHEEAVDSKLGYQVNTWAMQAQTIEAFADFLGIFDAFKEGDHTLLDRIVLLYQTEHSYARVHDFNNMPFITAGGANGRIKTGYHIAAPDDAVTRAGLTMQQALGVPTSAWGEGSNHTTKPFTEIMA